MKNFIFLISSIILSISLISCSNERDQLSKEPSSLDNKKELLLQTLSNYVKQNSVQSRVREKYRNDTLIRVIDADCKGAVEGFFKGLNFSGFGKKVGLIAAGYYALVTGAQYSINAYNSYEYPTATLIHNINNIIMTDEISDPKFMYKLYLYSCKEFSNEYKTIMDSTDIVDPIFQAPRNIGSAHNAIIIALSKESDLDAIRDLTIEDEFTNTILSEPEFVEFYQESVVKAISGDFEIEAVLTEYQDDIKDIYDEAINNCISMPERIPDILAYFVKNIYDSQTLTESEREELYVAMAVKAYSANLWIKEIETID